MLFIIAKYNQAPVTYIIVPGRGGNDPGGFDQIHEPTDRSKVRLEADAIQYQWSERQGTPYLLASNYILYEGEDQW